MQNILILAALGATAQGALTPRKDALTTSTFPNYTATVASGTYVATGGRGSAIATFNLISTGANGGGYACIRQGQIWYPATSVANQRAAASITAGTARATKMFYSVEAVTGTTLSDTWTSANFKFEAHGTPAKDSGKWVANADQKGDAACCAKIATTDATTCKSVIDQAAWANATSANVGNAAPMLQTTYGRPFYTGAQFATAQALFDIVDVSTSGTTAAAADAATLTQGKYSGTKFTTANATDALWKAGATTTIAWNDDFLLASVWQDQAVCKVDGNATTTSPYYHMLTAYSNTSAKTLEALNLTALKKCTFFIKVDASVGAPSFVVTEAGYQYVQLHYAEWEAGNMTGVLPTAAADPLQEAWAVGANGDMWPNPLKTYTPLATKIGGSGTTLNVPNYVDNMARAWNNTPGSVTWYGNDKGPSIAMWRNIDYLEYKMWMDKYNTDVATYNTAVTAYNTLATAYKTAVDKEKARRADSMRASFEAPTVVPAVPCLNANAPADRGFKTYKGDTDASAWTAGAQLTGSMTYRLTDPASTTDAGLLAQPLAATSNTITMFRAGWLQFSTSDSATAVASVAGTQHVFGLLGQLDLTGTGTVTNATELPKVKAFRYRVAPTTEVRHYMMVSLLPYDYTKDATAASKITLTMYKNEWWTAGAADFTLTAASSAPGALTQLGANALIASSVAFAAVMMTLQ